MEHKFEAFPDIKKLGNAQLTITQKIHGSNAQIYIFKNRESLETIASMPDEERAAELVAKYPGKSLVIEFAGDAIGFHVYSEFMDLKCGSRTRWIAPGNDNYGFAAHVYEHKQEFIDKLGPGKHFGEWAGLGINSGEGLKDKALVLFDHWKYPTDRALPPKTVVVPVLYEGPFDLSKVGEVMADLKANGSKLCPGFMRPEGVVVRIKGERYKVVFDAEETKWKGGDTNHQKMKNDDAAKALEQYGHLLQPMRLEKLLSKDERLLTGYPKTMPDIAKAYFDDLVKEDQVTGTDTEIQGIRKMLGKNLFKFVQECVEKQGVALG